MAGFIFEENPVELNLGTAGAWTSIDLTGVGSIPETARTAIILVTRTDTDYAAFIFGVQATGSNDDRVQDIRHQHSYAAVKLDSNLTFEYYVENADAAEQTMHLVGYSDTDFMLTDALDKSIAATLSWEDIDVTSDPNLPAGGSGVFWEISGDPVAGRNGACRIKGEDNDFSSESDLEDDTHQFGFCGIDADDIYQHQINDLDVDLFQTGYTGTGDGVSYLADMVDISEATNFASWEDKDLSAYLPAGAIGAIVLIVNNVGNDAGFIRQNGSTFAPNTQAMYITAESQIYSICGCDANRVIETYSNDNTVDHYLVGYVEPVSEEFVFFFKKIQNTLLRM